MKLNHLIYVAPLDYYKQKNNELDPLISCQVTSMIQAADICGLSSKFIKGKYSQPEDNLRDLILLAKKSPEDHKTLSEFTNKFLGGNYTSFSTEVPIDTILEDIFNDLPVVLSGNFPYKNAAGKMTTLGHVVTLIGVNLGACGLKDVTILDPYGDYHQNFKNSGYKVNMTASEFYTIFKTSNSTKTKWAHRWSRNPL